MRDLKCVLYGNGQSEPVSDACSQLTQEFFREDTLRLLINMLPKLNLEVILYPWVHEVSSGHVVSFLLYQLTFLCIYLHFIRISSGSLVFASGFTACDLMIWYWLLMFIDPITHKILLFPSSCLPITRRFTFCRLGKMLLK